MDLTVITLDSIGVVTIIGGSILAIMSRLPKETILNQKALIDSYEKRFTEIERKRADDVKTSIAERLENSKAIADLQGQIKVYKELPLQEMATAMQDISRVNQIIASSNQEILSTLKSSALIAATDRTEPGTVTEQHVVNQTVERSIVNREPVSEH